jgi:aryl carrier-like protein
MKKYILLIILIFSINLSAKAKSVQKDDDIDRMVKAFIDSRYLEKSDVVLKEKGNFIQLGAFSEIKPVKLIERLKQEGYRIRLKPIVRNSQKVNLLLAGPYPTEEQTQRYLHKLRTIVSGAFVYRP